jgi:hypothetical protein
LYFFFFAFFLYVQCPYILDATNRTVQHVIERALSVYRNLSSVYEVYLVNAENALQSLALNTEG